MPSPCPGLLRLPSLKVRRPSRHTRSNAARHAPTPKTPRIHTKDKARKTLAGDGCPGGGLAAQGHLHSVLYTQARHALGPYLSRSGAQQAEGDEEQETVLHDGEGRTRRQDGESEGEEVSGALRVAAVTREDYDRPQLWSGTLWSGSRIEPGTATTARGHSRGERGGGARKRIGGGATGS